MNVAAACDYTLYAQFGSINFWAFVQELDPVQSPYVLCLSGSTNTRQLTLDDTAIGCEWPTAHLIIQ